MPSFLSYLRIFFVKQHFCLLHLGPFFCHFLPLKALVESRYSRYCLFEENSMRISKYGRHNISSWHFWSLLAKSFPIWLWSVVVEICFVRCYIPTPKVVCPTETAPNSSQTNRHIIVFGPLWAYFKDCFCIDKCSCKMSVSYLLQLYALSKPFCERITRNCFKTTVICDLVIVMFDGMYFMNFY